MQQVLYGVKGVSKLKSDIIFNRNLNGLADTQVSICTPLSRILRKNKYKNKTVFIWQIVQVGWFLFLVEWGEIE